jgi:hypothetical protein
MEGIRPTSGDLSPARLRQRRGIDIHVKRLELAEAYLHDIERLSRYADDIRRQFAEAG